jgi:ssDNA-binding Zn-finger/Zn-ribbon topoisomerase 1
MSVPMWRCDICSHVSVCESSVREHMRVHVQKKIMCMDSEKKSSFDIQEYKCPHCTATCPDKEDMKRHVQSHLRKCPQCNYAALRSRHSVKAEFEKSNWVGCQLISYIEFPDIFWNFLFNFLLISKPSA